MNGAWADGAPREPLTPTGVPGAYSDERNNQTWVDPRMNAPQTLNRTAGPTQRTRITDRATARVRRIREFEGPRGMSARGTLLLRYVNYFLLTLLGCGLTGWATNGVKYAAGGGTFMLFSCATIAAVGAGSTLFYVNLRNEIVERVRHYIFGIILLPGTLLAFVLRSLQEWEWVNEGSLGTTLQAALPAIFLATVVLPAIVFVKEMVGIRTLHRSRLDDEEAVHLWTRHDGLQR